MIDEGPKVVIFSTHAKQLGEVSKDVKLRPEYKAYKREFLGRKGERTASRGAVTKSSTEFNDKWYRTIEVRVPLGWDKIEQQITYIDPYFTYMVSPTHLWRATYRTNEIDPQKIRKLLSTHPELAEPDGQARCREANRHREVHARCRAGSSRERRGRADHEGFPGGDSEGRQGGVRFAGQGDRSRDGCARDQARRNWHSGRAATATRANCSRRFPRKLAEPKQIGDVATELMAQLEGRARAVRHRSAIAAVTYSTT